MALIDVFASCALTRRSARSYLRPDIAASHRARPSFTAANPPQFRAAFRQPPRPCPPNQPASTHPHLFQESPKEALWVILLPGPNLVPIE